MPAEHLIDLRSDTVTKPTPEMRRAMAQAEVGDDVYREDPTVNRLEETVARLLGKERALFVVSGTMGNQVAIRTHTLPGDEVILDAESHIFHYECGAPAALSGVQLRTVAGRRGHPTAEEIEPLIRGVDIHAPRTRLISLENTHNRAGGSILPLETLRDVATLARARGLLMHLDGARLLNACVATGRKPTDWAQDFDSVSICFSKGLGAPVGSALTGSAEFIERARRVRKMFGGGMRQAGIIAAGALYALEHHVERLAIDHENARRLAQALAEMPGVILNAREVETNIVVWRLAEGPFTAGEVRGRLRERGVLVSGFGGRTLRCVTHLDVSREDIEAAIPVLRSVLEEIAGGGR
jgi:threonine aldolase